MRGLGCTRRRTTGAVDRTLGALVSSALRTAALRRGWYPVARAVDLDRPRQVTLLGRRLVVFRTAHGQPRVLADRCLHRGGALHLGAVIDDSIECPYHG